MDMGFKSYVVLKAVSMTEPPVEYSRLSMLNGKNKQQNLENINFWQSFYSISTNKIKEIINKLMQKKIIYRKTIQIRGRRYSMLLLTSKGRKILHILDRKYYCFVNEDSFTNSSDWDIIRERENTIYNYSDYL